MRLSCKRLVSSNLVPCIVGKASRLFLIAEVRYLIEVIMVLRVLTLLLVYHETISTVSFYLDLIIYE